MTRLKAFVTIAARAVAAPTVTLDQVLGETRPARVVAVRQVTAYLLRKVTAWSLPQIGRDLNRDHTTILHSVRRIERMARDDPDFAMMLAEAMDEARAASATMPELVA